MKTGHSNQGMYRIYSNKRPPRFCSLKLFSYMLKMYFFNKNKDKFWYKIG